ncbi:MAG: GcrA family cell cycle regulator [Rhodospirillales bacterium]|jgi:GcrA cell cycle regulator
MSAVEWTPERIQALMAMWTEGLPASEIGRRLDVTKNAVVGKVHRLGLPKRRVSAPPKESVERGDLVRLESLKADMCSWPTGDPGDADFRFCGGEAVEGKPYCREHCAQAYVNPNREHKETAAA